MPIGRIPKWLKGQAWKACRPLTGCLGSNPSSSARKHRASGRCPEALFFLLRLIAFDEPAVLFQIEVAVLALDHAGGIPVLAHPGNNLKDRYELFDAIIDAGVGGVEAFSSYHTPEAAQYFLEAGKRRRLLITCGSDYHGKTKPAIRLGRMHCTIDEHEIEAQLQEYGLL